MDGYITLDYELAMGNATGTVEKCLIKPMTALTDMLNKYGCKSNVFVDAAYLLKLRNTKKQYPQLQKDWEIVTNNIKRLDAEGHAIQLHLHPQWCYSKYDGEKWLLDKDHYKLSDIPIEDQKELIVDGVSLLNSLISKRVTSFRAGGYSVENFPQLYDTFLKTGIAIDSSVYRGNLAKGKYNEYDYRFVPRKTSWKFLNNHKEENND